MRLLATLVVFALPQAATTITGKSSAVSGSPVIRAIPIRNPASWEADISPRAAVAMADPLAALAAPPQAPSEQPATDPSALSEPAPGPLSMGAFAALFLYAFFRRRRLRAPTRRPRDHHPA